MNVLIACEESQRVCIAFRNKGHEAFSCDLQEPSGGHPEWHIMQDCTPLLNGKCSFHTLDGTHYTIRNNWDLIIAHPPCTNLTTTGMRWFKSGHKPMYLIDEAEAFFMQFVNAECDKICIENPVGVMSTRYRKPDQIIQPWMFGHMQQKRTCLWLKNLPLLKETNNVYKEMLKCNIKQRYWALYTSYDKQKVRSKTFEGIANAMADQWG